MKKINFLGILPNSIIVAGIYSFCMTFYYLALSDIHYQRYFYILEKSYISILEGDEKFNCIKEAHEQAESIKKQQEKLKFFSHFSILHWIKDDGEDFNFKYESNKKIIDFISETSELKFSIDSTGIKTYNWIIRDNQQFTDFYAKQMNISNKDSFYNKINAELKASFDSKNKVFYGTIEIWTRIDRGLKLDLISNEIVFLSELDSNSIIQKLDLAGFEKREMGKIII